MVVGSVLEQHDPMIFQVALAAMKIERPPLTTRMNLPSTASTKAGRLVLLLLRYQTTTSGTVSATKHSGSSALLSFSFLGFG
jgi:hypothetical protein